MEAYPSSVQDGHDFTDARYQLFGGEQQRGLPVLQQAMDYPALPTFPHMSQPSSISHPTSWAAKRVVGGFTGPPIETGATLPYRELYPSRQACMPTASMSRSITSGARAPQTQLQALTQAQLGTSAQPAFPAQTSSEAQPVSHTSMALHQSSAGQGPLSLAAAPASAPSLPLQGPHTTSGSALPSTSPALDSTPAPKPINWSSAASYPKLLMPAQGLMLPDGREAEAGMWGSASKAVPITQPLDSLNSTTTKEAGTLGGQPSSGVAVGHQAAVAVTEQAAAAAAPASEKHQWVILKAPSANIAQRANAQPQEEGNQPQPPAQNSHSNQSSGSHQERRLNPGSLGQSGSHDCRAPYDDAMPVGEGRDSGSDSADTFSQGVKRSRGQSSEVQGSATDAEPSHRQNKRPDLTRQAETLTDGRKMSDAEKRRIRRRMTNRESAKRIRDKREEQMTLMSAKVTKLEVHREALMSQVHSAEECCAQLVEQVKTLKEKWCATCVENVKLYKKIFELHKALNPDAESSYLASQIVWTGDQPGPGPGAGASYLPHALAQSAAVHVPSDAAQQGPCRPATAAKSQLSLGYAPDTSQGCSAARQAQPGCSKETQMTPH